MTRLEWTQPRRSNNAWVADAGHLRMVVVGAVSAGDVMMYSWEVGRAGRQAADFVGSHIVCDDGYLSLDGARVAAEEAALSLVLDAVAALAPDPAEDEWLSRVIDHDESFGVSVEATSLDAGDRAERLGCALIRESRQASAALRRLAGHFPDPEGESAPPARARHQQAVLDLGYEQEARTRDAETDSCALMSAHADQLAAERDRDEAVARAERAEAAQQEAALVLAELAARAGADLSDPASCGPVLTAACDEWRRTRQSKEK